MRLFACGCVFFVFWHLFDCLLFAYLWLLLLHATHLLIGLPDCLGVDDLNGKQKEKKTPIMTFGGIPLRRNEENHTCMQHWCQAAVAVSVCSCRACVSRSGRFFFLVFLLLFFCLYTRRAKKKKEAAWSKCQIQIVVLFCFKFFQCPFLSWQTAPHRICVELRKRRRQRKKKHQIEEITIIIEPLQVHIKLRRTSQAARANGKKKKQKRNIKPAT